MSVKRWKLGWKRCDCVKCDHALTVEQTAEDCGWVTWGDHKDEVARLKEENNLLRMRAIDDPVIRKAMLEVIQERAYVGQYPNPVNMTPIKQSGDDKKGDAS